MRAIRIDRNKPLAEDPHVGHNRYHPDIAPVAEVGEGEEIALETRDALDGQIKPGMKAADLAAIEPGVVHPLTGPVFVKGAAPGDLLEIEFTDILAQPTAFSAIMPGLGFCAMYSPIRFSFIGESPTAGQLRLKSPVLWSKSL